MKRPDDCKGCTAEPSTPGYDPTQQGEFVPPSCSCPLHQGGPAMPEDECQANMLVVGMAPSGEEVRAGKPLVGPAGRKFEAAKQWALSGLAGEGKDPVYVKKINMRQCRSQQPGLTREVINRDPTKQEIQECAKRFLIKELKKPALRVVCPMGQLAFNNMMDPDMKFNESLNSRIKQSLSQAIIALGDDL